MEYRRLLSPKGESYRATQHPVMDEKSPEHTFITPMKIPACFSSQNSAFPTNGAGEEISQSTICAPLPMAEDNCQRHPTVRRQAVD